MILHSIKWSLQLWHGLILLLVLAGFGYTAFELQRTRELRRVDEQLQDRLATIFTPRPRGGPDGRRPPLADRSEESQVPARVEGNLRPEEFSTNRNRGPSKMRFEERFRQGRLPEELPLNFGPAEFADDSEIYHVIWRREQRIATPNVPADLERPTGERSGSRTRATYREHVRFTPRGDVILVGRSIEPELRELRRLSVILLGTGLGILVLGLAGGWVVSTHAMQPIESITSTALKISNGDLSQRIPQDEAESELGRLVSVLNSTFTRLETAFSEQVRFTTDVSHELRTPVSVIVSQTQMALTRDRTAPEYRETLEACQRAAQRMRGLIESLMQLARLDAGQERLHPSTVDLAEVASETIQLLDPLSRDRNLKIVSALQAAKIKGDAEQLGQVLLNLITNAIHYTPPGGIINVSTRFENNFAILSVADTGAGIPAEDLPRVFDRFYRVEKSRSREKGGSGLGLSISRAIVSAHSGSISAESKPGEGTTFTVRIPAGA